MQSNKLFFYSDVIDTTHSLNTCPDKLLTTLNRYRALPPCDCLLIGVPGYLM